MFKKYLFYFFLNLIVVQVFGQTFGDFSFSGLPQDYQLYPRNSKNVSDVSIKVKNTNNSTASIGLLVYRNATLVKVLKPSPSANLTTFTYSIPAELAEYDFHWYTYSGKDSTLLVKRSNIVSGDVILVSGQSNAKLGPMDKYVYQGEWLRTFGKNKLIQDLNTSYNLADTLWNTQKLDLKLDPIASDYLGLGLGPFASELGKILIESEKVPVAIISNAQPSTPIDFHANMNGDLNAPKGSDILYYRAYKGGFVNDVKTFVFIQGEAEMLNKVAGTWLPKFSAFKTKLKSYFPNLVKIAVPQLNIYAFRSPNAASLRNEQRKFLSQSDMLTWATVGNTGFDGLHYYGTAYQKNPTDLYLFENKGYFQMANEVGRLILKDVYKKTFPIQVQSPNIQKAYFPDADTRNKVILEFEEGQVIKFAKDTTVTDQFGKVYKHELKNYFFYDRFNQNSMGPYITNISSDGKNKVTLEFNIDYDGNTISYLPEFHGNYDVDQNIYPFPGPFLKNELGMRAFAFSDITIEEKNVYSDDFQVYPNPSTDWIELKWKSTVNGTINLVDAHGKVHYSRYIENRRTINLNLFYLGINTGKYYLQFISDLGGVSSKPIIKL